MHALVVWALAAAVAVRAAAEPTPRPWPTYGPGEPREGEPVMPAVPADPADPAIQAEAKWAVDYLKTMSDSGIYATLELLRIVDAFTQEGVFHNNTLMTAVLGSPHLLEGTESTHQLIVMTDLRSGKRSAFAVDEFPAMQPGAVEQFWRAKVEAHRARREAVFAALEAGVAGGQKDSAAAAGAAAGFRPPPDASAARLVEPTLPTVPGGGAPSKQALHHQPDQTVPDDTGTCAEPPPLDHATHMALQEIARRTQQPGFVPTAEDMAAILSFSGSGAARILPASVVPEPTPDPEKVREHKRRRKMQKAMLMGMGSTEDAHDDHDDDALPDVDPSAGGELTVEVGEFNVGADGEITNTGSTGASAGALRVMEEALKKKAAEHKRQQQEGAGKRGGKGKKRGGNGGKGAVELSAEEREALLGAK